MERLFINLADPAFDAVGRDKNNGIYCMVENTSNPPKPTDYELSVVFFPQQPILRPEDRAALEEIYDQCCSEPNACPKWKQLTPEGSPGPFLEFCGLPKQGCDGRGRLLQLNMDGWGLQCPFPAAALGKMASLMVLRMGTGHVFTGDMAPALATLGESLDALEVLHVAGNPAMGGPMIDPSVQLPAGTPPPLCKMATTLQLLQLSDNSIEGSIPACLVSSSSSIVFLDLGMNKLSGNIPDAWDAGSPMTDVFLDGVCYELGGDGGGVQVTGLSSVLLAKAGTAHTWKSGFVGRMLVCLCRHTQQHPPTHKKHHHHHHLKLETKPTFLSSLYTESTDRGCTS